MIEVEAIFKKRNPTKGRFNHYRPAATLLREQSNLFDPIDAATALRAQAVHSTQRPTTKPAITVEEPIQSVSGQRSADAGSTTTWRAYAPLLAFMKIAKLADIPNLGS
ncbi:hypothetical protein AB0B42_17350 [Streptomyces fradiae]|uniref:hypothetical protein n=1 Tax=Streptomyces fradiae TaxID=1906 RepID=UPI0033E9FA01